MPLSQRTLLNKALTLPTLGFGGAALGGLYHQVSTDDAKAVIQSALEAGVNYLDTAPYYGFGRSERVLGDVLRDSQSPFILSTKVGRLLKPTPNLDPSTLGWPQGLSFTPIFDYSYDAIMRSYEDSLQRLGLPLIDILYMHDIGSMTHGAEHQHHFKIAMESGYKALDELRRNGHIKAFGIGVNEWEACKAVLDYGDWDVFLLAGRYTLLEQEACDTLLPNCLARKTSIVIGGPFNSGLLVGGDMWNYAKAPSEILAKRNALQAVCQQFQISLPAAALQFPLAHPAVVSVIPGVRHTHELTEILAWSQLSIPTAFWDTLKEQGLLSTTAPTPLTNLYQTGE